MSCLKHSFHINNKKNEEILKAGFLSMKKTFSRFRILSQRRGMFKIGKCFVVFQAEHCDPRVGGGLERDGPIGEQKADRDRHVRTSAHVGSGMIQSFKGIPQLAVGIGKLAPQATIFRCDAFLDPSAFGICTTSYVFSWTVTAVCHILVTKK